MSSQRKVTILAKLSLIALISIIAIANNSEKVRSPEKDTTTRTIEWKVLCEKFPLNSSCQQDPPETIKISLAQFGAKDEWIRIDRLGNLVTVLFTRRKSGGFISRVIDGGVNAVSPDPVPFSLSPRSWSDRQTTQIIFQPDHCVVDSAVKNIKISSSGCIKSGMKALNIPQDINIREGLFTLEYLEEELLRSITFRIPIKAKSEIKPIVVEYDN